MANETPMILVTAGEWHSMTEEQRHMWEDLQKSVYYCGDCSTENGRVFHNQFGYTRHQSADELAPLIPEEQAQEAGGDDPLPETDIAGAERQPAPEIGEGETKENGKDPDWPDPNEGSKHDVDLGDGHTLTWSTYEGDICGGIIRHTTPITETTPLGYCDGAFWLRGNKFTVGNESSRPQWDLTGSFEVPTLAPSFQCHCGDHGFVREGRWVRA